jgi:hypothetical protein
MTTAESKLHDLTRGQAGNVTRNQLCAAGIAPSTVYRWTRRGLLVPVGASTFRLAGTPQTRTAELLGATLETGGAVSHTSGLWLRGLVDQPRFVDLVVARARPNRHHVMTTSFGAVRVHTTTSLPAADVDSVDGVPTLSVARSLLTLGSPVPAEMSEKAYFDLMCKALDHDLATERWLIWLLERRRCRGRNGVSAFEDALADRLGMGPTESWLERSMFDLLDRAGLPLPTVQRVIRRQGRFVARVDFHYELRPVVLEAMGYRYHRTRQQLDADTRRANELQAMGYAVYQFTSEQIATRPEWVADLVGRALRDVEAPDPHLA